MFKSIDKNTLNLTLLTLVMASMLCCSITAVSFSSVFYIPDLRRGRACCFLSAKNPERRWENVMIYLRLFLNFLMIGASSFGGGYGMVSLVRERVLSNGWLTENEFLNFIAVSESTPGPLCREYGNLYRLNTGRNPRFICCNAGRGVAVILIILLIASALKNLMKYAPVNAFYREFVRAL